MAWLILFGLDIGVLAVLRFGPLGQRCFGWADRSGLSADIRWRIAIGGWSRGFGPCLSASDVWTYSLPFGVAVDEDLYWLLFGIAVAVAVVTGVKMLLWVIQRALEKRD